MKYFSFLLALLAVSPTAFAQNETQQSAEGPLLKQSNPAVFTGIKVNPVTTVKDQQRTNTCWSFSTISLIESQMLASRQIPIDLSEMYIARCMYREKARNYITRQGRAQFAEGGLGHDVLHAISRYGAVPESAYSGISGGQTIHDHSQLYRSLKGYLDSILKNSPRPISVNWMDGFEKILDKQLGSVPTQFVYNGKSYTPMRFASEVLQFQADDYIGITSFTHEPYFKPFIVNVPDNFSNGAYYNLPLADMVSLAKKALRDGHTIMWDADVSNSGFMGKEGYALHVPEGTIISRDSLHPDIPEARWDARLRQEAFETLLTQDDHLMHIAGIEQSASGKTFFWVKNSWGTTGPFRGFLHVSEAYLAMNTICLILPKAALSKDLLDKLLKGK